MNDIINEDVIEKVVIKSVAIYKAMSELSPPPFEDKFAKKEDICQQNEIIQSQNLEKCLKETEPSKENEITDTTNETKSDYEKKSWKDITDPKLRRKAYKKAYREANKDKLKIKQKNYDEANKDKRKVYLEVNKEKIKLQRKSYRKANKEKIKLQTKTWCESNKEKLRVYREANKEKIKVKDKIWRESNKEKIRIKRNNYSKNRLKTNVQHKLGSNLRNRLRRAINGNYKAGSAVKDLGCSIDELVSYLESKFQPGMTWDNHGVYGWHIDHIKPLASFDLTDRNQLLDACHYTNLQPLWAKDNLSKKDKLLSI